MLLKGVGRKTTQEIFYEADISEQKLFKYELVGTGRLMQYITGTERPDDGFLSTWHKIRRGEKKLWYFLPDMT